MLQINNFNDKNKMAIKEICLIFDSIKDKLLEKGIIVKPFDEDNIYFFHIKFDKTKIKQDSIIAKHNINIVSLSYIPYYIFKPEIFLINDGNIIETDELSKYIIKRIDDNFIFKNILIYLCELIGINLYNEELTIDNLNIKNTKNVIKNLKGHKDYTLYKENLNFLNSCKTILKNNDKIIKNVNINLENASNELKKIEELETEQKNLTFIQEKEKNFLSNINLLKKNSEDILKYVDDKKYETFLNIVDDMFDTTESTIIDDNKKQITKIINDELYILSNIIFFNDLIYERVMIENMKFENILFPGIFNLNTEPPEQEHENIILFKNKYIKTLIKIQKFFKKFYYYKNLEKNYKSLI